MATFFITMHACLAAVIESYTDRRWQGSSHFMKLPQLWKGLLNSTFYLRFHGVSLRRSLRV